MSLNYTSKTPEEIKSIAFALLNNSIFTDRHISQDEPHMLGSIFMPLALGAFKDLTEEEVQNIGLIYESLDKAGPRAINGYPSFFSFQYLDKTDSDKVFEMARKIQAAVESV